LTELVTTSNKINREDREGRKEDFYGLPAYRSRQIMRWIPSLMRETFRVHTSGTADKRIPAILAQALYGLPPPNRQYDAELLPYPSQDLIARQQNEPKFLRGLRCLRGSKYKKDQLFISNQRCQSVVSGAG